MTAHQDPQPVDLPAVPGPDPRLAWWAARLRAAIGEEKRRATQTRPTRVIARDPIRAVIAEMEAPPGPPTPPPPVGLKIDPKAESPTPPDTVHAERLAAARARCTHDVVEDGVCHGCACEVIVDA